MTANRPTKGIEELIEDAIRRGEFDNLKGKGQPLNLDAYFETPEELRSGHALLKSAGFLPEELELQNEITALEERHGASMDDKERKALRMEVRDKRLKLSLLLERLRRRSRRK